MAGWLEGEIVSRESALHYYRMGSPEKPTVLLLHGFTDSGLCWLRFANDLAADYDVIMTDAVGHGRSGDLSHGFRERAVADVLAVLDTLALDRPALVGHSMGGATAAGVAAAAPERVRALVLEDPGWRDDPTPSGDPALPSSNPYAEWVRNFQTLAPEERARQAAAKEPNWDESELPPWIASKVQFDLTGFDQPRPSPNPWREVAANVVCPTLLVTSEPARGGIITRSQAQEILRLLANGREANILDAGHNIRRDNYAPFHDVVVAFLGE
jgi:N-formylmaleamate deformylase